MTDHIVFIEMSSTGAGEQCLIYARDRGYDTTLIARQPDAYGSAAKVANRLITCDVDDRETLLGCVAELAEHHPIDGVTTTHDLYVPHTAQVAQSLGLPGLAQQAAAGVRNKYLMRQALHLHCPWLNPPFRLVRSVPEAAEAAAEWGFPLIAKPQDANDSWQVVRIDSETELADYMRSTRTWHEDEMGRRVSPGVLLEGYLDGAEYTVETAQHKGGDIQLIGVSGKEWADETDRHFAELAAYFPVRGAVVDMLFAEVAKALRMLDIDCGVIHTECRVVDGQVKILEINPRLTGDLMGSHVIELACGASPVQQVVEIALGRSIPWRPTREDGAAIVGVCGPPDGVFTGIANLEDINKSPGVVLVREAAAPGTRVHTPPQSNADFVAWVVTVADTPQEALELAYRAVSTVRFA